MADSEMADYYRHDDHNRTMFELPGVTTIGELVAGSPNDLRRAGWVVAVHNDYKLAGVPHTFWLFTKDGRCVKGEGVTDRAALNAVRKQLGIMEL